MKLNTRTTTVLLAAAVTALPAVAFGREGVKPLDDDAASRMVSLSDSIEPLVDQFNADKGKLRLVTLLSPT